jgi:hypothetical protein
LYESRDSFSVFSVTLLVFHSSNIGLAKQITGLAWLVVTVRV